MWRQIGSAAILAIAGLAVAQSPTDTFTLPPTTLPAPAATDPDALRAMIREELKAEQKKAAATSQLDLKSFVKNGFMAETEDKAFHFHFGGRFDYDNAWFRQDDNLLIGPSAGTRFEDGTAFRRARLRADGRVWGFIDFVTEVNFATIQEITNPEDASVPVGSVGLIAFNLTFRDLPFGNLRVGLFKPPYGLERHTSANVIYYMERSSIFDAFYNPNNIQSGLQFFDSYLDDRITLTGTFTRIGSKTLNTFGFNAQDGLYATGARVTGLPIYEDDGRVLMHLGLSFYHQALEQNRLSLANRMPLRAGAGPTDVPNLLATDSFFSPNGETIVDGEWAVILGPFSMSAEYAIATVPDAFNSFDGVRFSGPRGDVTYHAWYVEAGYFVTPGDRRRYDKALRLGPDDPRGERVPGRGRRRRMATRRRGGAGARPARLRRPLERLAGPFADVRRGSRRFTTRRHSRRELVPELADPHHAQLRLDAGQFGRPGSQRRHPRVRHAAALRLLDHLLVEPSPVAHLVNDWTARRGSRLIWGSVSLSHPDGSNQNRGATCFAGR